MIHFIGFRNDEYNRAIQVFGKPDFIHRSLDNRAISMIADEDTSIFANGAESKPTTVFSFDDSAYF